MSIQTLFGLLDAPQPAKTRRSVGLQDAGELVQLLAQPEPTCPHCGKKLPKLRPRRRRLYALVSSAGALLHLEIDP